MPHMRNPRNDIFPYRPPKPAQREAAVTEELIELPTSQAHRPEMVKPYRNINAAELNRLYGTLRVADGWQHVIDNYAKGGLTTIAAATVAANVSLAQTVNEVRLSRWPGAVSMYLCIRSFGWVASTATFATAGSVDLYYQDTIGGQVIPLGSVSNNDELNISGANILIPTPITDGGQLSNNIGQIQATLSSGATVGTYIWQMAFSYAYLLPTDRPYTVQHVEELMDGHPGHSQQFHR